MKKLKPEYTVALIGAGGAIVAAIIGFFGGSSYATQQINNDIHISTDGLVDSYTELNDKYVQLFKDNINLQSEYDSLDNDYKELKQSSDENEPKIQELEETKNKLEESNSENQRLQKENEDLKSQINSDEIDRLEKENTEMQTQLEEKLTQISDLTEENKTLTTKINNTPNFEFPNSQIYLDGGILSDLNNPIISVDGNTYYNESTLKKIFGHYGIGYQYAGETVNIGNNIETEKLPISKAEIYDIGEGINTSSGIRTDKSGNEFSGLLIYEDGVRDGGYISYFVDEKYNKIEGIIHVAKETENENLALIEISIIDKNDTETVVYRSNEMTNLSESIKFSDIDISGAKVVKIIQDAEYARYPLQAVISEAYFYNE